MFAGIGLLEQLAPSTGNRRAELVAEREGLTFADVMGSLRQGDSAAAAFGTTPENIETPAEGDSAAVRHLIATVMPAEGKVFSGVPKQGAATDLAIKSETTVPGASAAPIAVVDSDAPIQPFDAPLTTPSGAKDAIQALASKPDGNAVGAGENLKAAEPFLPTSHDPGGDTDKLLFNSSGRTPPPGPEPVSIPAAESVRSTPTAGIAHTDKASGTEAGLRKAEPEAPANNTIVQLTGDAPIQSTFDMVEARTSPASEPPPTRDPNHDVRPVESVPVEKTVTSEVGVVVRDGLIKPALADTGGAELPAQAIAAEKTGHPQDMKLSASPADQALTRPAIAPTDTDRADSPEPADVAEPRQTQPALTDRPAPTNRPEIQAASTATTPAATGAETTPVPAAAQTGSGEGARTVDLDGGLDENARGDTPHRQQPDIRAFAAETSTDTPPKTGQTFGADSIFKLGEGSQMLTADNAGQTLNSLGVSAGPSSPVAAGNLAGAATPGVTPGQHAQTPATMVAAPQEVVDIVSNRLAGDDRPDKIMVQLDPPELGRVSIEFKFDAQGLSQVAVRGESAEAIKQLRLLHFDLVQSLEQHGLSARAMTFSQNFSQQQQQQDLHDRFNPALASEEDLAGTPPPIAEQARNTPAVYGSSGLNIKL